MKRYHRSCCWYCTMLKNNYRFQANRGMLENMQEDSSATDPNVTHLKLLQDRSTAISSSMQGSNLDAVGFNLAFIALRNPTLAIQLIKLYGQAHEVKASDPKA